MSYAKAKGIYLPAGMKAPARASFDSSKSGLQMSKRFEYADARSADEDNDTYTRTKIRSRARYETQNSTYARGITLTVANDTIGTGPRLQFLSTNRGLNRQVERDFARWATQVQLAAKLSTVRIGRMVDGESLIELVNNPGLDSDVKLDIALYEADYLVSPYQSANSKTHYDGIDYDAYGNPTRYWLMDSHPGSLFSFKGTYVPKPHEASSIIHYFRVDRAGQRRGVSEIQSALELFNMLRTYTKATIDAAETAANHAGLLFTQAPPDQEADDVAAFYEESLARNMMKALPFGWDFRQMKAEQPTTTYPAFKNEIINEIARCLNVPFNIAALNSSDYNYASGRLDHQAYYRALDVERSVIESTIVDKIFNTWIMEYALLRGLTRTEAIGHRWYWDGPTHIDPMKAANAQHMELVSGTTTLASEYAKKGQDWEEQLEQRAREVARIEELGLTEYFSNQNVAATYVEDKDE